MTVESQREYPPADVAGVPWGDSDPAAPALRTFADVEERLAVSLPGYESRPPQQRLASEVEALFADPENFRFWMEGYEDPQPVRKHLFAQAGTGTGKSLAYSIPAVLAAVNDRRRVVVSVTTKALQDQLSGKDFPFLDEHLGVAFSWTVLKGRSNYLCLNKAVGAEPADVPALVEILNYAREHFGEADFSGTREQFPFEISDVSWSKVNSEADECSANNCKQMGGCFAAKARARAQDSQIVIVNHSLLFTDLLLSVETDGGASMLGEYDLVIFDEAHEAEDVAANTLGGQFSEGSIRSLTAEVRNWAVRHADQGLDAVGPQVSALIGATTALFARLEEGRLRAQHVNDLAEEFGSVFEKMNALSEAFRSAKYTEAGDYERARLGKSRLTRRIKSTAERFSTIIVAPWDEVVRFVETDKNRRTNETRKVIKVAPINVAPFLREHLFAKTPAILVSATMSVLGKFDYMAGRLGVDHYTGLDVGTPFNYPEQARLYVPLHLPDPIKDRVPEWEARSTQEMVSLIRASRGRALVLFTSYAHMQRAFESVKMQVPQYPMKMQGQEPPKALADWFRDETHSVLFGTRSFFTGVDFQGETCSLVIISKMPFPVPTEPLFQSRVEAVEQAGGDGFREFTIPVMSLVLQQGAGRAIRHREDKAVVAILDPRIMSKGYGKQILRDLPPMPVVTSMAQVVEFFGEIDGEQAPVAQGVAFD